MKKLIPILLLSIFSFQNYAQDGALYQEWFLVSFEIAGENTSVSAISPSISPNLIIELNLEFFGFAACNNYTGNFSYDSTNDLLTLTNFDATLNLCDYQTHNEFETTYYSFLNSGPLNYSIIYGTEGEESLELENASGNIFRYNDTPIFSINDNLSFKIKLYPNPVNNNLFIAAENTVINKIVVYSISGKMVVEHNNLHNNSINVSNLSKGMYFIEITSTEGKTIKKFVKK